MTESTCHSDKGGGGNYWRFMAMVSTSTVIMFFLMYANSFDMDDVFWSETRFWMMFVMGAMMMVVMLDRKSTRLNSVTNAHLVCRLLLEKKKKEIKHIIEYLYVTHINTHHNIIH